MTSKFTVAHPIPLYDICQMKKVLVFGAGKSATHLISYLLDQSVKFDWRLTVADASAELARRKIGSHPRGEAIQLDIQDAAARTKLIEQSDIVVSMMPPHLHSLVAIDCLQAGKNLLTASYVDEFLRSLDKEVKEKGLIFLCESGLDPGIDHMSAMEMLDHIRGLGAELISFRSHCGGLVAPESDNNPWHYKISWNPRNIVMAGKAGAHYREAGRDVKLSHLDLFSDSRLVSIPGLNNFAWYPNRDSLSYEPLYGLADTPTFVRTTLRHPHFIRGWHILIALGLTEENPLLSFAGLSWQEAFDRLIDGSGKREELNEWLSQPADLDGFHFSLLWKQFTEAAAGMELTASQYSAADLLQIAAERAWKLQSGDMDMIVMLHELEYKLGDTIMQWNASLVVKGEDADRTAMSKTVGLPLGIACKLILTGEVSGPGVRIPITADLYKPILKELAELGIEFNQH